MIKYSKLDPIQVGFRHEGCEFVVRDCGHGNWAFRVELRSMRISEDIEAEMIRFGLWDAYLAGNIHPVRCIVTAFHTDWDPEFGKGFGPIIYCEGVAPSKEHWGEFDGKDEVYRKAIRRSWQLIRDMLGTLHAEPCADWIESNILDKV
jgi:hypothetical protein